MRGQRSQGISIVNIEAALLLLGLCAQAERSEPFGLPSVAATQGQLWITWREVLAQIAAERPEIARCRASPVTCTSDAALRFIAIEKEGDHYQGASRIGRINRAVNLSLRQIDTGKPSGMRTRWTSPLDSLASGAGDCKQYALVKYAVLLDAGFSPDDVRLVILGIRSLRETHAVVTVRDGNRWLVLYNRTLALVDSRELRNYTPLFAMDYRGVHQFVLPPGPAIALGPCDKAVG
jgi:predicted transglutaminase-like cysteine proteinase